MKLIYVDESGTYNDSFTKSEAATNKRKSTHFVLSALIVDIEDWEKVLGRFKTLRADVYNNFGISKSEQLHAHEFIGGKGVWRHIKYAHLTSPKRRRLLKYLLTNYAAWPDIKIISVAVDKLCGFPSINSESASVMAYQNLFNRVDKTLGDEDYIVIHDGQEDTKIIRILRKMRAYNSLNTSYAGRLDVRVKSLIEDPVFKYSRDSYFLQAIDHIAYATLHLFDERLNPIIGRDLLLSEVYNKIGLGVVHRPTSTHIPGVVMVPMVTYQVIAALHKKSLGISPDSSSGAGLTR